MKFLIIGFLCFALLVSFWREDRLKEKRDIAFEVIEEQEIKARILSEEIRVLNLVLGSVGKIIVPCDGEK